MRTRHYSGTIGAMKKHSFTSFFICTTLLVGGFFLATSNISKAQTSTNITDSIILEVIPRNPSPGQQVRVEVESFVSNLRQANIAWSVDGTIQQQEIGNQTFFFIAPEAGEIVTVDVIVTLQNGSTYSDRIIIEPGGVDIIIEGITYTPPMYSGRPLFTHESQVNIAALPTLIEGGRLLTSDDIFYRWEVNDTYIRDVSGVGRDNIIYTGKVVSLPITIQVTAESLTSEIKAKKQIIVTPLDPELALYETNPLQGTLFGKSLLGEFNLEREELTLTAIPYFFDVNRKDDASLDYYWAENRTQISTELTSNELTLTNVGLQNSGTSNIGIAVNHTDYLLQDASTNFTLNTIGNNQINIENDNEITVF